MAKFPIEITADDKTGKAINKVGEAFARLAKGGPFEKLSRGFETWQKSSKSMGEAWKAIGALGDSASGAAGGLGEAADGAGALAMGAGVAGLAVGVLAIGLGKAAEMGIKFETSWSAAGRQLGISSQILGLSARDLQTFQGAGALAGVSADQMTGSLQGLGNTLNDAKWGRNNTALALWNQMGLKIKTLKNGSVDTKSAMLDLAKAMERYPPQTRQMIAGVFGVSGALPFLQQGLRRSQAEMDAYTQSGAAMTDEQIAQSTRFQNSLAELGWRWQALENAFASNIVTPWAGPLIDGLGKVLGWLDDCINAKLTFDRVMQGLGVSVAGFIGGPGAAMAANAAADAVRGPPAAPASSAPKGAPAKPPAPAPAAASPGPLAQIGAWAASTFDAFASAIENQESGHRQFWRSGAPKISKAGAVGVMQLLPGTAAAAARRLGIGYSLDRLEHDANYNRTLGREELRFQLQNWGGDKVLAAAAYNAGPKAVERWIKRFGDPREGQISDGDFARQIPFAETRRYIADTAGLGQDGGRMRVDVHFHNTPRGTVVTADSSPNIEAQIGLALQPGMI